LEIPDNKLKSLTSFTMFYWKVSSKISFWIIINLADKLKILKNTKLSESYKPEKIHSSAYSAATSSFAFAGPEWHLDLVRVGSALWGVRTAAVAGYHPAAVVTLTAPVLAVRRLPAGATLGYYRRRGPRPMHVATLALGYADGLPDGFTEHAAAWVDGVRAPFVAEATMSLTTIDVTDLPPGRPAPGDSVEIVGPRQDVNALGTALGLNPNRLLTAFGATLARRYRHPAATGAGAGA
jgi:alanine racemase